jgi:Transketolase
MAVGAAIAERFLAARFGNWMSHYIYAFISDGGIQEEISQGAGRIAGYLGLNNLIMFYDSNNIQLSTDTEAVTTENTAKKYESWGWNVITIDGNDAKEIIKAIEKAQKEENKPTIIIGNTIMGKGAKGENNESFEKKCSTHGQPLSAAGASIAKTIENLGGNPENPFELFEETKELYSQRREELIKIAAERKAKQAEWAKNNPELAEKLEQFFSGKASEIDYASIVQKPNQATRNASATVLGVFAKQVGNMVVSSADLANSDKTDGFLKNTHAFKYHDFSGAFFQAGVCELSMAAIMNGMALHGGIIPACGTFFVFSDYEKPAIRISALMEQPTKFIWSHDAFRVGEDGPTHQPVEQEAQIRLLEQLKNHSGKNSMLVLRPADSAETTVAWKMAMENNDSPTGLILSRQNVKDLPATSGNRYEEALQAQKGAYIVIKDENPDVILVANGSEVATLVDGAALLKERKNIQVQIVSAPSIGLFLNQSEEYRNTVIPKDKPIFGLTAGLPSTLTPLVGANGKIWGLDHFGYSAPYTRLDEEFGFTAENVYKQVTELLNK